MQKMCTGFATDVTWVSKCAVSLGKQPNQLRAAADVSPTEQLSSELRKSESVVIASTLLVVKAKKIYRNTSKMHVILYLLYLVYIIYVI